jgi:hypothetical protein
MFIGSSILVITLQERKLKYKEESVEGNAADNWSSKDSAPRIEAIEHPFLTMPE